MEYLCNPVVFLLVTKLAKEILLRFLSSPCKGHFLYRHSVILRLPRQPRTTDTEATVFKEV